MDAVLDERCAILSDAWLWWVQTLRSLDESAWRRNTRLGGWDVASLVAHHALLVQGLEWLPSRRVDAAPEVNSAAEMLRRFNEPGGIATTASGVVADMARGHAASLSTADLVSVFVRTAPDALNAVRRAGPAVVDYFGQGTLPLSEAVSILTMEAVVHGFDLYAAVGTGTPSVPAPAIRAVVGLLAAVADPVMFIEAATGRTARAVLPVLR
jgi:uncharacterized protein (TIGR03083 family)